MALTEEIQAILNQIQAAYPKGIRTSAEDENSTVYKYDVVRATSISDDFRTPFINATNDLCSLTATLNGLQEWENFLGIPINLSLSMAIRRAGILAKLAGSQATISTIKQVALTAVGGNLNDITVTEEWVENPTDPDAVWTYTLSIHSPGAAAFTSDDLRSIIEQVHPAHCVLLIELVPVIIDSIGPYDTLASGLGPTFVWADSTNPLGGDALWRSLTPVTLDGVVWAA